ncbi:MAG TPA: adenylate/guanylate cyclase domain-containing protein [Methylomirabilota bacterium]|nr:adenylate/guanylate cyclase domain-containing protein [Methylomirabilota bacterium]
MAAASRARNLMQTTVPANLVGALVTYAYFRFVDYEGSMHATGPGEIAYFVVGFSLLIAIGYTIFTRWSRPLATVPPPPGPAGDLARRRAVQLPYVMAAVIFLGWVLAGFIWGVGFQLIIGEFTPMHSARMLFGIVVISGLSATTLAFLRVEHRWRQQLPAYFPEGGLATLEGVPRLPVRARLLAVLLLVAVLPVSVLGMASYRGAREAMTAGAGAEAIMARMIVIVLFLVVATIVTSAGLALFVARSVALPLRALQRAMARVERGDFDVSAPVVSNDEIGALTEGFNAMVRGLRERELLRETFGKYVSQEVRDEILAGRVSLAGQVREVTILFADLRDFTTWVEATDPREVVRDLNAYFTEMEVAIRGHGGLVLQYIGDEIEAVFGAPVDKPGHAEAAVRAALDMRGRLAAWNAARTVAGKPALRHGIGVHTGNVVAGNIGSSERLSYALVGDPVNLASRIQGLTKELSADLLVSSTTRERLGSDLRLRPLPAVKVKGRAAEVEVYAVD